MTIPVLSVLSFAASVLMFSTAMPAAAQNAAAVPRPDPADAAASVPPAVHQSSFSRYQGFADPAIRDWRESNDTVGRIGGWRAYAREGSPPRPQADKPAARGAANDGHSH